MHLAVNQISTIKFLRLPLFITLCIILASVGFVHMTIPLSGHVSVLDITKTPTGQWDWNWAAPFYAFDPDKSNLFIEADQQSVILKFDSHDEELNVYNGFGIKGNFDIPISSNLTFSWKSVGKSPDLQIHLSDASPETKISGIGEHFNYYIEVPGEKWKQETVPLASFKRNSWQPKGAPTDGILHSKGINRLEFGLEPGINISLIIKDLQFVWFTQKKLLLAIQGLFFTVGLFLLARYKINKRQGEKINDYLIYTSINRVSFILCFISFGIILLNTPESFNIQFVVLYSVLCAFIILDDLLPVTIRRSLLWSSKYFIAYSIFWFSSQPLNVAVFSIFYLMALINIAPHRKTMFFLYLLLPTCLFITLHPYLGGELMTSYLISTAVITVFIYLILEYISNKELHQEMERTAILYEGIFTYSSDAIYTLDSTGRVIDANRGFSNLVGKPIDSIIGVNIEEFIHQEDHHKLKPTTNQVPSDACRYDAQFLTPTGKIHYAYVTEYPIISNGEFLGKQVVSTDITQRLQIEKELQQANEKLLEIAMKDALTEIANRRYFDEIFVKEWQRCIRRNGTLTLLMIDIDFFKLYNDTYGHQKGDLALNAIAKAIDSQVTRSSDVVARYGGEEFVVLLPDSDTAMGASVATKIIEKVRALELEHSSSLIEDFLTISVGVAAITPTQQTEQNTLFSNADEALYKAKKDGRNCYSVYNN